MSVKVPVVIDRCCFRCHAEFPTGSRQALVYCPACVSTFNFPVPVQAVEAPVRRVAAATSGRRDAVTVRTRCEVCGGHVKAGESRCGRCVDQLAMFSAKVDRRRKEWRDEG
ncbi:MAG: hypothetical protein ACR2MP_05655 [Streptosporangiaceae bacterium]